MGALPPYPRWEAAASQTLQSVGRYFPSPRPMALAMPIVERIAIVVHVQHVTETAQQASASG
ncbi:hypothetical protein [Rhodospirillum sp. A1_3_36]|uniref:hypothetical protein n=1 Tax=Rhodospirillum sp. A1_3_36 TaxID=3391666 RepID=UPI0039A4185E